jgi:hypothetical protein
MQKRLNLKKSIKKEIPTTATIYGKNVEDPIMLDQSHAFFGRGGGITCSNQENPFDTATEPSFKRLWERLGHIDLWPSRKANSEKMGGGVYSPIVTHCFSE